MAPPTSVRPPMSNPSLSGPPFSSQNLAGPPIGSQAPSVSSGGGGVQGFPGQGNFVCILSSLFVSVMYVKSYPRKAVNLVITAAKYSILC